MIFIGIVTYLEILSFSVGNARRLNSCQAW